MELTRDEKIHLLNCLREVPMAVKDPRFGLHLQLHDKFTLELQEKPAAEGEEKVDLT